MPAPTGGARAVYLSASAAVLYDNQGNIYGAIESIRDITYHKKAEEQKRKAEKDLKEAHDNLEMKVKERTAELESRNAEMDGLSTRFRMNLGRL